MNIKIREPFNGFSHLLGAILSVLGLVLLIRRALLFGNVRHMVAYIIFGTSLILLYSASAIYHLLFVSDKVTKVLRYIDHMMIYILIAGSYTPLCLITLKGKWGNIVLTSIWVLAIAGIITTGLWLNAPRWLSTSIYLIMGWLVAIITPAIIPAITLSGFAFLLGGGILYSVGAVIYGLKKPNFAWNPLGFHEIFHLFILAGSFCHYLLMYKYVL